MDCHVPSNSAAVVTCENRLLTAVFTLLLAYGPLPLFIGCDHDQSMTPTNEIARDGAEIQESRPETRNEFGDYWVIALPEDWSRDGNTYTAPVPNTSITVLTGMSECKSSRDLATKISAALPERLPGYKELESGNIEFSDGNAFFVESTWQGVNLGQIHCVNYYFVKDGLEAHILCGTPEADFDMFEAQFRTIARTFRFTSHPSR